MIIAIADIGAGTSDCVPYMVKCGTYIRPVEEVCEPRGNTIFQSTTQLCSDVKGISVGANDINTIVNSVLKSRLASQKQLDDPYNNVSRDSVRESFMTRFEDSMKSGIDLVSEELRWWVPGAVSICITVYVFHIVLIASPAHMIPARNRKSYLCNRYLPRSSASSST
jgi:hypothetical protein